MLSWPAHDLAPPAPGEAPPPPPDEHQELDGGATMALSMPTLQAFVERPSGFATPPDPPDVLVDVCTRAMQRAPTARYPSAMAFADALEAWLDGARRREEALQIVAQATERRPRVIRMRRRAERLSAHAAELLDLVRDGDAAPSVRWTRNDGRVIVCDRVGR